MSDGMSDAAGIGRLAKALRNAAAPLREAIEEAAEGHHGFSPDIEEVVNYVLGGTGFRLCFVRPEGGALPLARELALVVEREVAGKGGGTTLGEMRMLKLAREYLQHDPEARKQARDGEGAEAGG